MKLVFATDGSECSEKAAVFLKRFDFSPTDEIAVLYVVSDIPYADDYHAQIRHAIKRVAPKILRFTTDILEPLKAKISPIEEEGLPDSSIIRVAADLGANLIVMGARGLKGFKSFLLGSVTRSVAINSPIPILVTRPAKWEVSEKMKVLFATDGSRSSTATADLLASMPFPDSTELIIINVAWPAASEIPERFVMEIDEKIKADIAFARAVEVKESERIIDLAKAHASTKFASVREMSGSGDPSTEILSKAEDLKVDLIAVGSRGLKGMKGMLGSVSRRVLARAGCPVLVGKAGE
jgi:nucleotide-binding universal stress UspA family protein